MGWVATSVNWNKALLIRLSETTTEQRKHCQVFQLGSTIHSLGSCLKFKKCSKYGYIANRGEIYFKIREDTKSIESTISSNSNKASKCLTMQPLKAFNATSPWYWAEIYSQKATRGRKREDTVYLFSEWRVSEVWTGFHIRTMARIHPAVLSLLLSLPVLRLSICFWVETHGTSCSAQHTSQKFTSCSSALLLHTNPIPRTCITRPSCA